MSEKEVNFISTVISKKFAIKPFEVDFSDFLNKMKANVKISLPLDEFKYGNSSEIFGNRALRSKKFRRTSFSSKEGDNFKDSKILYEIYNTKIKEFISVYKYVEINKEFIMKLDLEIIEFFRNKTALLFNYILYIVDSKESILDELFKVCSSNFRSSFLSMLNSKNISAETVDLILDYYYHSFTSNDCKILTNLNSIPLGVFYLLKTDGSIITKMPCFIDDVEDDLKDSIYYPVFYKIVKKYQNNTSSI